ncbi:MAG: hypothetical protein JST54_03460 [Deltaproteobacteria bacterium]|nr:hypothetical protein [Deltaproteobacteria bacterium]
MKRVFLLAAIALAGCNQPLYETSTTGTSATGASATGTSQTSSSAAGANGAAGATGGTGTGATTGGVSSGAGVTGGITTAGATTTTLSSTMGATGFSGSSMNAFLGQRVTPEIVFVVDRSNAMAAPINTASQDSKSVEVRYGLTDELVALGRSFSSDGGAPMVGLVDYPKWTSAAPEGNNLCLPAELSVALTPLAVAADGSNEVPTADAIDRAVAGLTPFGQAPLVSGLTKARALFDPFADRYVVVIAAGAPNCNQAFADPPSTCVDGSLGCVFPGSCYDASGNAESSDTPLGCADTDLASSTLTNMAQGGIPTLVIGVGADLQDPTSTSHVALDQLGLAGGLLQPADDGGAHFELATDQYSLQAALSQVDDLLQTECTIQLAQAVPADATLMQISTAGSFGMLPRSDWTPSGDGLSVKVISPACGTMAIGVPQQITFYN